MTDSERQQILKMIEDGKISAEQGLVLMQALDEEPEVDDNHPELPPGQEVLSAVGPETGTTNQGTHQANPDFDRKINRFRSLWVIPLWLGVAITVAGAYWMYTSLQAAGFGFSFFFRLAAVFVWCAVDSPRFFQPKLTLDLYQYQTEAWRNSTANRAGFSTCPGELGAPICQIWY